jgi:hypothetical protein
MRSLLIAAALGSTAAIAPLPAQATTETQTTPEHKPGWELLVSSGVVVPTGAQRTRVAQGKLTAAQVLYVVRPAIAVTASLGWARTRDIATVNDPKLDAFTYDVGAELRAPKLIGGSAISLSPFAGIGAGGRSYNYRSLSAPATSNVAGYGSVGGELGVGRIRLRLEARDYLTGFRPLAGEGAARSGNDVVLMGGLRFVRR